MPWGTQTIAASCHSPVCNDRAIRFSTAGIQVDCRVTTFLAMTEDGVVSTLAMTLQYHPALTLTQALHGHATTRPSVPYQVADIQELTELQRVRGSGAGMTWRAPAESRSQCRLV